MGDSVCIGIKEEKGIKAIDLHCKNRDMVNDVLRLLAIHKVVGFKRIIDKYPCGFSAIFPLYKFLGIPEDVIVPYFSYGIDYGERGDNRHYTIDVRNKDDCYIVINDTTIRHYSGYGTSYKTYRVTHLLLEKTIKDIFLEE